MNQAERNFARRVVFAAAPGAAAGRSMTVVLALAGFDPAVEIDAGPTVLLSDLFWEANEPRLLQLKSAWKRALPEFPPSLNQTRGPVSLAFFSASKLGWVPQVDPGVFRTRRGRLVNFSIACPTEIRWESKRDAELALWKEAGANKPSFPPSLF